ncbi:antitoxin VapB7 [soil metagenome]
MYERRLQVLLDEARYRRVSALAQRRGVSVATVIREAIDRSMPHGDDDARGAALEHILSAAPMHVPDDPADLRAELEELRGRHR